MEKIWAARKRADDQLLRTLGGVGTFKSEKGTSQENKGSVIHLFTHLFSHSVIHSFMQGEIPVKWSDSRNQQLYLGGEAYGSQLLS